MVDANATEDTARVWAPIDVQPARAPLLADYEAAREAFGWGEAWRWVGAEPDGPLNMADVAVDRWARGAAADAVALRVLDRAGPPTEVTYAELAELTDVVAVALQSEGVARGEAVCTLLERSLPLYATALGTLKAGAVYCPLFPAFGPGPVEERLRRGRVRVLVTDPLSYARKVEPVRGRLPDLRTVVLVGAGPDGRQEGSRGVGRGGAEAAEGHGEAKERGTPREWGAWLAQAGDALDHTGFTAVRTGPEDPALLHFTSGTTGAPKGAVHVHAAIVAHHATARLALDVRPGDVYWCTADPGWVTGTSYGILGPLSCGATVVTDTADFDARRWYEILDRERVTVWYTAPTALRLLRRAGPGPAAGTDLSALRHVASVGEPLNGAVVVWATEALGIPVHDTWWQTETGAIIVSNFSGMTIRPGSMGRAFPGVDVSVLERGEDGRADVVEGRVRPVREVDAVGELAVLTGWPSMFRGYLEDEARYRRCFADGWYLTGDLARVDADGYVWFVGRADDVIKSAGHLIGPFEVESVLMEHPAVAEVGVIGTPDPIAGEVVKAFVTLRAGRHPTEALRRDLIAHGRRRLGSVAPRAVEFDQHLPHTRSGKVMRRLLKSRELGLDDGDVSTVEPGP